MSERVCVFEANQAAALKERLRFLLFPLNREVKTATAEECSFCFWSCVVVKAELLDEKLFSSDI